MFFRFFMLLFCINSLNTVQAALLYQDDVEFKKSAQKSKKSLKKIRLKASKNHQKQLKKTNKGRYKIQSPRAGKVFLIIGIIALGIAGILALTIFLFPLYWIALLVSAGCFLLLGLWYLIQGLHFIGRNNNWDADYK